MYESVLDTIGHTPIVRLQRLAPPGMNIYVKLESRNPGGSVKDRMALACIEDAERRGLLRPGQIVVEGTSGNTGIALAMVCAARGYPLVVVMAENFSVERRRLMRFMGARVVLTPAALKGSGMMAKARELAAHLDAFLVDQFANPANARAHELTTAREILAEFSGRPLACFVTGTGTGGTLRGVGAVLRRESSGTRIVACEPDNAPVLASGKPQPPVGSHPDFRPHLMQGWTPDFIPALTAEAFAAGLVDHVMPVAGDEAMRLAKALACEEGILTGISGGATLAGAISACATLPPGSNVLVMLPDSTERYLSTPLFEQIADAMDAAEWALSRATPGGRFGIPPPPAMAARPGGLAMDSAPAAAATNPTAPEPAISVPSPPPPDPESEADLDALLADAAQPVLVFALAWCEYCWSIRKMFSRAGIAYRAVELDSPAMQPDDRGGRLRRVLQARSGSVTIPQVFVGGQFVGGCNDVFASHGNGTLAKRLAAAGVTTPMRADFDANSLLPSWQQPADAGATCMVPPTK